MGESRGTDLRVRFDRRIRLQFQGAKVTSDAGLLAVRELDEALGLMSWQGLGWRTRAQGATSSMTGWRCYASRSIAGWRGTRTPMMPSGWQ